MREDSWGLIEENEKLSSAKKTLDWVLSKLDPKEVALLLTDHIAHNQGLIGSVFAPSDIRDMFFIRLYKDGQDPTVGEKADVLSEQLISSSWWQHNLINYDDENKLIQVVDNFIEHPELYLDNGEYAF